MPDPAVRSCIAAAQSTVSRHTRGIPAVGTPAKPAATAAVGELAAGRSPELVRLPVPPAPLSSPPAAPACCTACWSCCCCSTCNNILHRYHYQCRIGPFLQFGWLADLGLFSTLPGTSSSKTAPIPLAGHPPAAPPADPLCCRCPAVAAGPPAQPPVLMQPQH